MVYIKSDILKKISLVIRERLIMPTIKDIANYAGVSHGTVSNVLNKKGNVSSDKIRKVEEAAQKLGYALNAQAKSLRGASSNKIACVVPDLKAERYNDLFSGLTLVCEQMGYDLDIYVTKNKAHNEIEIIKRVMSSNPFAVVTVSCLRKNKGNYSEAVPTIFIERDVKEMTDNSCFISFDFEKATRQLMDRAIAERNNKIAILMSDADYSYNKIIERTLIDNYDEDDIVYKLIKTNDVQAFDEVLKIFEGLDYCEAIVCFEDEYMKYLNTARTLVRDTAINRIYSIGSRRIESKHAIDKLQLDYLALANQIKQVFESIDGHQIHYKDKRIVKDTSGFCFKYARQRRGKKQKLRMLALKSPTIAGLKRLLGNLQMETGIDLEIVDMPYDMLYEYIHLNDVANYDLLRIDMAWLDGLAETKLREIGDYDFSRIKDKVGLSFSQEYTVFGDKRYAIPFDPSVQLLFYRKDIFNDALTKREFYERYKRQLTVPQSFKEYNEVLEFFDRRRNRRSPVEFGSSLVYGLDLTAAHDFFPRIYDFGVNMKKGRKLNLVNPEMKKALLNYVQAYHLTHSEISMWWEGGINHFASGKTAMGIYFSNYGSSILKNPNCKVHGKIGFCQVPGGNPLLGGGVLTVAKKTEKIESCYRLFDWLYSDKVATIITLLGGYIDNRTVVENVEIHEFYPWLGYVAQEIGKGVRRQNYLGDNTIQIELIIGEMVKQVINDVANIDYYMQQAQNKMELVRKGQDNDK